MIEGRFAPRDDCAGLAGWKPFAAALRSAVGQRDAQSLAALAADDIKLDFGGGAGKEELVRRLGERSEGNLWEELDQLLKLGCARREGQVAASLPWFWEQNLGGADPFEVWLVTGDAVPLLASPQATARPKALLGWVLVRPVGEFAWNASIQRVRVEGGDESGYIETRYLRSQVDYRLIAERVGASWRITHLIAGD